jgi:phosphoribosylanthranilate isomerase
VDSPRYITPENEAEIIGALRGDFLRVGVFVHPTNPDLASTSFLDVAQIHGRAAQTSLPIWKAVRAAEIPPPDATIQAWFLDTPTPAFGGSGETFDWSLAAGFPNPKIVAGGLDAGNVAEAIRVARPWGVDSCSRLESAPGRKDHHRVAAFVTQALQEFHAQQIVNI